jgi:hypothetical protein
VEKVPFSNKLFGERGSDSYHEQLRSLTRKLRLVLPLISILSLVACSRGYSRLNLPTEPILSGGIGWAVVTTSYARLSSLPQKGAPDVGTLRRGTVFQCLESKLDADTAESGGIWYRFDNSETKGWVFSSDLVLCDTNERALSLAKSLQ